MILAYYPITLKYFWRIFHVHLNYFHELAQILRSFRLHLDPCILHVRQNNFGILRIIVNNR